MYGKTKNKSLKTIIVSNYIDGKLPKVILQTFKKELKSWRKAYKIGLEWALQQGHRTFLIELQNRKGEGRFSIGHGYTEKEYQMAKKEFDKV